TAASTFVFNVTKHPLHARGGVVLPTSIIVQRAITSGRVAAAGVVIKGKSAGGGIITPGDVAQERVCTARCVVTAVPVAVKSFRTSRSIAGAVDVSVECIYT